MLNKDEKRFLIVSSILIVVISFLTYWTSLNIFFIGFDFWVLNWGRGISGLSEIFKLFVPVVGESYFRPLQIVAAFFNYRLWGLNPIGYHVVSIAMHSINSILVLFLAFLLLKDRIVSLGAGLLFAIHPIHSAVLLSLAQRPDLMCTLFYLLSLVSFAFCVYLKRYRLFYLISIIAYPLALFSKEMAITLPLVIILYDSFLSKSFSINSFLKRFKYYSPYILFTFFYLSWRLLFTGNVGGDINPVTGRSNFFDFNVSAFIKKIIYYVPINFLIPLNRLIFKSSSFYLIGLILILSIIIMIVMSFKEILKNKLLILFSFLWMTIILIPAHNHVQIEIIPPNMRYYYPSSVGLCIALAFVIFVGKIERIKKYLSLSIFAIICTIYIFVTVKNNAVSVQSGEINRDIPRIVNEYHKKYGTDIRYYFLIPDVARDGEDLFTYEIPNILAPLFAPVNPESVVLLGDEHNTDYSGNDFDLRQPDIIQGLGDKVFFFYYNTDKGIFEDLSVPIKSNLMQYTYSSSSSKLPQLVLSGSPGSTYESQSLNIPAYLIGGAEVRMRVKIFYKTRQSYYGVIRWYKDGNSPPQRRPFDIEGDDQFHTYQIPFSIHKPDWTQDAYVTKIELMPTDTDALVDFEYIKLLPYQR